MFSTKVTSLLVILCLAIVSSCENCCHKKCCHEEKEIVAGQVYKHETYTGPTADLTRFVIESKDKCRQIAANVYGQVTSVKILNDSPNVEFYGQDNCQGNVIFKASPGQEVPNLEKVGVNDRFKSYKFVLV